MKKRCFVEGSVYSTFASDLEPISAEPERGTVFILEIVTDPLSICSFPTIFWSSNPLILPVMLRSPFKVVFSELISNPGFAPPTPLIIGNLSESSSVGSENTILFTSISPPMVLTCLRSTRSIDSNMSFSLSNTSLARMIFNDGSSGLFWSYSITGSSKIRVLTFSPFSSLKSILLSLYDMVR